MLTLGQVRDALRPHAWFTSLDLKNAYWHVPVHPRFRSFLAVQDGSTVLRFRVMPFGLNIAPRVFTKLTRTVAALLAERGVSILMYLDDWLIQGASQEEARHHTALTISLCSSLGFAFNIPKSVLLPSPTIDWLGMSWDSSSASLRLSADNRARVVSKLRRMLLAVTASHRLWAGLMGSLNFAAQVVPLGRLWCRRLWWEGNRTFPRSSPHLLCPLPRHLRSLLHRWMAPGLLMVSVPWWAPPPHLTICMDALDFGWGYQSSDGLQGRGCWSPRDRRRHINVRELLVPHFFLLQQPHICSVHLLFRVDNMVAVQCIAKMGSTRSLPLLRAAEGLFSLASSRRLTLSAAYLPGRHNVWADALSRMEASSVEWALTPDTFADLCDLYGRPEVDIFAAEDNHLLPLFLTRTRVTAAGGPDALLTSWATWSFLYLFPPTAAAVMAAVVRRLRSFQGRVLLVAPFWRAQPWCQQLLRWCPRPLPLNKLAITGRGFLQSGMSSDFHVWSFSRSV